MRQSPTLLGPGRNDLFHARVPLDFVHQVFAVIADTPQHTYQVLTKRSSRLRKLAGKLEWPPNLWMGVSVEDASALFRVDDLRAVPAAVRFLSCEPLIGPLDGLDLDGIDWVIAGGESGPGHRPVELRWIAEIRDRCIAAEVPFFFKLLCTISLRAELHWSRARSSESSDSGDRAYPWRCEQPGQRGWGGDSGTLLPAYALGGSPLSDIDCGLHYWPAVGPGAFWISRRLASAQGT